MKRLTLLRHHHGIFYFREVYKSGDVRDVAVSETEARYARIADDKLIPDASLEARAYVCAEEKIAAIEYEEKRRFREKFA